jgi:hypothetical protein
MFPRLFAVQVEVLQLVLFMLDQIHLLVLGFRQGVLQGAKSSITSRDKSLCVGSWEIHSRKRHAHRLVLQQVQLLVRLLFLFRQFPQARDIRRLDRLYDQPNAFRRLHISNPHHRLDPRT